MKYKWNKGTRFLFEGRLMHAQIAIFTECGLVAILRTIGKTRILFFFFFFCGSHSIPEKYMTFFFFKKYKKYLLRKWLIRVYSHFEISDTLNGADI